MAPPLAGTKFHGKKRTGVWQDLAGTVTCLGVHGSRVARWDDASGNGNQAVQVTAANRPSWNDVDGLIEFSDGLGTLATLRYLEVPSLAGTRRDQCSIYYLGRSGSLRQAPGGFDYNAFFYIDSGDCSLGFATGNTIFGGLVPLAANWRKLLDDAAGPYTTRRVVTSWTILGRQSRAGGTTMVTADEAVAGAALPNPANPIGKIFIGGAGTLATFTANGGVGEFHVVAAAPAAGDVATMRAYSDALGGSARTELLGIHGDSISDTSALLTNDDWVRWFARYFPRKQIANVSQGGVDMATETGLAATYVDTLIDPSATLNECVLALGSNDFSGGTTGVALYAIASAYVLARLAAGWNRVYVCTILPRADHAGARNAEKLVYNALVRAGAGAPYGVFDWAAHPIMGVVANTLNPALFDPIGVHPAVLGSGMIGVASIEGYLGRSIRRVKAAA